MRTAVALFLPADPNGHTKRLRPSRTQPVRITEQPAGFLSLCLLLSICTPATPQYFTSSRTNDIPGLKAAAERGDFVAQHDLGGCYLLGIGMPKDPEKAVFWFRRAAQFGHPDSQFRLGLCYFSGQGVKTNRAEAVMYFQKAAEQHHVEAQHNIGYCYATGQGIEKNGPEALHWLQKAAEAGNVHSQIMLAHLYLDGRLIPKDVKAGIEWLRKGVESDNPDALYNLGICYAAGIGVKKDLVQAYKYIYSAKAQGFKSAGEALAHLESDMTPEELAQAKLLAKPYIPAASPLPPKRPPVGK